MKGHQTLWKDHYQHSKKNNFIVANILLSVVFLTKQVEVINTFVLAKLYQYFGDFDWK